MSDFHDIGYRSSVENVEPRGFFTRSDRDRNTLLRGVTEFLSVLFHILCPILAKFGIGPVHVLTLISEFCENSSQDGPISCCGGSTKLHSHAYRRNV